MQAHARGLIAIRLRDNRAAVDVELRPRVVHIDLDLAAVREAMLLRTISCGTRSAGRHGAAEVGCRSSQRRWRNGFAKRRGRTPSSSKQDMQGLDASRVPQDSAHDARLVLTEQPSVAVWSLVPSLNVSILVPSTQIYRAVSAWRGAGRGGKQWAVTRHPQRDARAAAAAAAAGEGCMSACVRVNNQTAGTECSRHFFNLTCHGAPATRDRSDWAE